jgi:hypothetical protein
MERSSGETATQATVEQRVVRTDAAEQDTLIMGPMVASEK